MHFIVIAHTKSKDIDDPTTGESYSILTSNISQKYFNALKTKLHFLGVGYIDRTIIKEKTGKKNIVTNKDIERSVVKGETRVINFRDDNFSVDSKSRFADITNEPIPFDVDALIKAMQDAILAESRKGGRTDEENKELQAKSDIAKTKAAKSYAESKSAAEIYAEKSAEYIDYIKVNFSKAALETKSSVKNVMAEYGFEKFSDADIPLEALEKIVNMLKETK